MRKVDFTRSKNNVCRWACVVFTLVEPQIVLAKVDLEDSRFVSQQIRNLNFWKAQGRPDLARQIARKILRVEPRNSIARSLLGLEPESVPIQQSSPVSKSGSRIKRIPRPVPKIAQTEVADGSHEISAGIPHSYEKPPLQTLSSIAVPDLREKPATSKPETGTFEVDATPAARDRSIVMEPLRLKVLELSTLNSHKPGTDGVSTLRWHSTSLRISADKGEGSRSQWQLQLDHVELNSGSNTLGQIQESSSLGSTSNAPPLGTEKFAGNAEGVAFAISYESPNWRWDLGTTPIGFVRSRLTAGIQWNDETPPFRWRLRADTRPVSSSLLSYSGQIDPVSGRVWGGVDRQALEGDVRVSLNPLWEWKSQMRWASFEGYEVRRNQERWFQTGMSRSFLDTANAQTDIGTVVEFQEFHNNQNAYGLGHGGYYSPQSRQSIGLVVNDGRAKDTWMWRTRLSLARSWVRTDSSPDMPFIDSGFVSTSRSSTSDGGAIQISAERVITSRWVMGTSVTMERAPDYQFNALMVYVRWREQAQQPALSVWPSRVFPGLAP